MTETKRPEFNKPAQYGEPLKVLTEQEAMRACTPEELAESEQRQYSQYRVVKPDPLQEARQFRRYWNGQMNSEELLALPGVASRVLKGLFG